MAVRRRALTKQSLALAVLLRLLCSCEGRTYHMLLAWRLRTQQELAIRRRRGAGIAAAQPGKHAETTRTTPSSVANSDLYEQHWYITRRFTKKNTTIK